MRIAILITAAALTLAGCESDYARFYTPLPTSNATVHVERFAGEPQIIASTGSAQADLNAMYTRGFGPIGVSDFNGPVRSVQGAIEQAKSVGAEYLVVSQQYASTVSGAIPMTTFVPQTTYSSGVVTVDGTNGYSTGSYNGTSTTYNQETSYIPFSVQRYDQTAVYYGQLSRSGIGLRVVEIGPADAQRLGTQRGVIVTAVRRGSPAFDADILPGDVLVLVAGQPVYDRPGVQAAVVSAFGTDATVTILRSGQTIQKTVHLPPGGVWP